MLFSLSPLGRGRGEGALFSPPKPLTPSLSRWEREQRVESHQPNASAVFEMNKDFKELRLEAVSRRFDNPSGGQIAALKALTITIPRGEFVALLGPSGCGKSTALNCIAGLLPLSSGSIWLDTARIDQLPPEKRGFGIVFQNYALFPHMTVRSNVGFGLKMRGVPKAEIARRVSKVFDLVQLTGHEDKLPGQLSGGQQQRVAIARAIVIEPPLLMMDEPLSNLDAKLRLEMRAEIWRIHRELGRATIYVTHDQDEALSLADRIVVMEEGEVQQIATPPDVYGQPATLRVARFMGYRNLLDLNVEEQKGDIVVLAGDGLRLEGTIKQPLTGRRVCAAIRPEEISVAAGENPIEGRVDHVEYCGRDSLVHLVTAAGLRLQARTHAATRLGDTVRLSVPRERVLVYPHEAA
jgi:putative spermidine/putrescine transport system ATP-binding protein